MLIAMISGSTVVTPGAAVVDPEKSTVPYTISGRPPYNAPEPCKIVVDSDTPESCTHPSVWDFGPGQMFGGFRYWMAITDYGGSHKGEDPNILCSQDGFNWQWPAGLTNPIWDVPRQNAAAGTTSLVSAPEQQWNSDTELHYDVAAGKLVCFWREMYTGSSGPERLWSSSSTDGVTWESPVIRLDTQASAETAMSLLSPGIVTVSDTDWRMFTTSFSTLMRTASTMYGPWSAPQAITVPYKPWHWGVAYHDGIFYALGGDPLRGYTSRTGLTWTTGTLMSGGPAGTWDNMLYRPMLRVHPDGRNMRVWYSSQGIWRAGYTIIPISAWPAPPA